MKTTYEKLTAEQAEKVADSLPQETMYFEEHEQTNDCIDDFCGHYWIAGRRFAVFMDTETEREFEKIRKQLMKAVEEVTTKKADQIMITNNDFVRPILFIIIDGKGVLHIEQRNSDWLERNYGGGTVEERIEEYAFRHHGYDCIHTIINSINNQAFDISLNRYS